MGDARLNLLNKMQDSAADFIEKAKETTGGDGRAISE
jgi:hypothetical protein